MTFYTTHPLEPWDAPALFGLTSDVRVTKYLGFRTHTHTGEAAALIADYKRGPGRWFGVYQAHAEGFLRGPLLGVLGIEKQGHAAGMAIYFSPKARGAGRPAAIGAVQLVFDNPAIKRVFAHCHVDNVPVQRVLQRMGATREGRMRNFAVFPNISPEPADCYLYSILPGELRGLT